ncbi:zinc finger CCCH domain-containing protein 53-like [Salvia divinorum]|uniref:Zinc finger CCCH domain-containing protein 53-like n=1 Tax=Salvia divinorum TaxID=28513 RepID=A0ABD1HTM7_SALDI
MHAYEATKIVFQRIQSLEPENASKIMGFLLIQDVGEKEMIRLAFGPESLIQSVIIQAKIELSLNMMIGGVNLPSPLGISPSSWTSSTNLSDFLTSDDLVSLTTYNGPFYEVDLIDELQLSSDDMSG